MTECERIILKLYEFASRGANPSHLIQIKCTGPTYDSQHPSKKLHFATVNPTSVCNKTGEIISYVHYEKIDICAITETWLTDLDSVLRQSLSQRDINFSMCLAPMENVAGVPASCLGTLSTLPK